MISLIFEPTYQVRFVVYLIFFSRTAIQLKSIKLQSKMILIYFSVFEKVGHKDQFKSLAFKSMDYQWSRSCIISYHNFYLFFPICKRKEFKLFQLLERFKKKNVLMHHPSIKKSLDNAWSMILKQFFSPMHTVTESKKQSNHIKSGQKLHCAGTAVGWSHFFFFTTRDVRTGRAFEITNRMTISQIHQLTSFNSTNNSCS